MFLFLYSIEQGRSSERNVKTSSLAT